MRYSHSTVTALIEEIKKNTNTRKYTIAYVFETDNGNIVAHLTPPDVLRYRIVSGGQRKASRLEAHPQTFMDVNHSLAAHPFVIYNGYRAESPGITRETGHFNDFIRDMGSNHSLIGVKSSTYEKLGQRFLRDGWNIKDLRITGQIFERTSEEALFRLVPQIFSASTVVVFPNRISQLSEDIFKRLGGHMVDVIDDRPNQKFYMEIALPWEVFKDLTIPGMYGPHTANRMSDYVKEEDYIPGDIILNPEHDISALGIDVISGKSDIGVRIDPSVRRKFFVAPSGSGKTFFHNHSEYRTIDFDEVADARNIWPDEWHWWDNDKLRKEVNRDLRALLDELLDGDGDQIVLYADDLGREADAYIVIPEEEHKSLLSRRDPSSGQPTDFDDVKYDGRWNGKTMFSGFEEAASVLSCPKVFTVRSETQAVFASIFGECSYDTKNEYMPSHPVPTVIRPTSVWDWLNRRDIMLAHDVKDLSFAVGPYAIRAFTRFSTSSKIEYRYLTLAGGCAFKLNPVYPGPLELFLDRSIEMCLKQGHVNKYLLPYLRSTKIGLGVFTFCDEGLIYRVGGHSHRVEGEDMLGYDSSQPYDTLSQPYNAVVTGLVHRLFFTPRASPSDLDNPLENSGMFIRGPSSYMQRSDGLSYTNERNFSRNIVMKGLGYKTSKAYEDARGVTPEGDLVFPSGHMLHSGNTLLYGAHPKDIILSLQNNILQSRSGHIDELKEGRSPGERPKKGWEFHSILDYKVTLRMFEKNSFKDENLSKAHDYVKSLIVFFLKSVAGTQTSL
jgi:hypothetical protein